MDRAERVVSGLSKPVWVALYKMTSITSALLSLQRACEAGRGGGS